MATHGLVSRVRPFKSVRRSPHARPGTSALRPHHAQCQVETPPEIVQLVWRLVGERRRKVGKVLDLGAGDGRFSRKGEYDRYIGYEIDRMRRPSRKLRRNARIEYCDALSASGSFDLVIGNPPYGRNQDLSVTWRRRFKRLIADETGDKIHGLQNLYVYFMWLSVLRCGPAGLVALVVPFEWVSRPSARPLRTYLRKEGWSVSVYRLPDSQTLFPNVKTTASVTLIDKVERSRVVSYFHVMKTLSVTPSNGPTVAGRSVLPYDARRGTVYANRGFSPGSQAVFVLTEDERREAGIRSTSVVPCVTSLRHLSGKESLDEATFRRLLVDAGQKCWLLRTDLRPLSRSVRRWLDAAPEEVKTNSTCSLRGEPWHEYRTPEAPQLLYAAGFRGQRPKVVTNPVGARNVGSVHGVFGPAPFPRIDELVAHLRGFDFAGSIVAHARGLMKVEVRQMNGVLNSFYSAEAVA